jgi:transcription initiation factor TFIID/TFIIF subunit
MSVDMFTSEKGGKITVFHDLNFQSPTYDSIQTITFKNPASAVLNILRETGSVASEEDAKVAKARKLNDGKKRKAAWDYERMADCMTKLEEDDLLHVIQMIHDHKSDETYTKNDIDAGEFSVDLYTMPDSLSRMIWDFLVSHSLLVTRFFAG